jgi:fibronectin type 3 domain-containing protein
VLHEKWIVPMALVANSDAPNYRDTQFDFAKTYVYLVRSVTTASGNPLESSDSDPLVLIPVDIFPPATPQEVAVAVLVNPSTGSTEVDLSWSINAEPDLAGYRVYRSEQQEDRGQLVTPDLLLSPAYRDTSVAPDHSYWYRVTAVDRSGNESVPTPPVAADVAQHSP